MKYLCLLLLSLIVSCSCSVKETDKIPESRPVIALTHSIQIDIFKEWSDKKSKEWSIKLGIREPKAITLVYGMPDITSFDEVTQVINYIAGKYIIEDEVIMIWVIKPNLTELTLSELKEVFRHEYIHHLFKVTGVPQPIGEHNEEFERLAKELQLE